MYVDGPNMFVELKNKKLNKNIFLFGNAGIDVNYQKDCDILDSLRIDKFLNIFFKKTKKKIDFYVELTKEQYDTMQNYTFNGKYIELIRKLYVLNKNKYKNVKFHLADIRDDDYYSLGLYKCISDLMNLLETNLYDKTKMSLYISYLKENILEYIKILNFNKEYDTKSKTLFNIKNKTLLENYNYLKNDYNNVKIKKKIYKIIKKIRHIYRKTYNYLVDFEAKYNSYHHDKSKDLYYNNCINANNVTYKDHLCDIEFFNLKKTVKNITYNIRNIYSKIMNAFLIKKILENKNKNIIVYVNSPHTLFITSYLIKKCNYEIINLSNDKINIKTFNDLIKKTKLNYIKEQNYYDELYKIYDADKFFEVVYDQCVDLKNTEMFNEMSNTVTQ